MVDLNRFVVRKHTFSIQATTDFFWQQLARLHLPPPTFCLSLSLIVAGFSRPLLIRDALGMQFYSMAVRRVNICLGLPMPATATTWSFSLT